MRLLVLLVVEGAIDVGGEGRVGVFELEAACCDGRGIMGSCDWWMWG